MPRLSKIGAAALAAFGWTSGDSAVTASYLVVAGGAGGGGGNNSWAGGGGGAGGYLTGITSLNPTDSYTVTVGAGGAGAASGATSNSAQDGTTSVFSVVTTVGGGGGMGNNATSNGRNGGSGGGGAGAIIGGAGGSGTSGQGNAGGSITGSSDGARGGCGGGGANAAGGNVASDNFSTGNVNGGAGGAGLSSSITGSSVTRAGGGGGGAHSSGTVGAAGSGGGGQGGTSTVAGSAGSVNTGGGGGGGGSNTNINQSAAGGNGGSGIVIVSYPAPQKFGGGVVTASGANIIHTFTSSGVLSPLSSLTASYLVVAGGGGGGGRRGGGGGAGGLLSGSGLTLDTNSIYAVTVGAGGAGGSGDSSPSAATVGSNSLFSMVTTTAIGGGGGGAGSDIAPSSGGSGGGGARGANSAGAAGTSGQGNAGGSGDGSAGTGGGGGAGAVGGSGTTATSGNGGNGSASSISGSSVTYAGGGGGGGATSAPLTGTAGSGGTGGGGNGSAGGAGSNGTTNLGAGGGGGGFDGAGYSGGTGGSGVVIISYAGDPQFGGGTITSSGGNTIHTFTSSGLLSPIVLVNNSLRFRSSASAYLNRTPASAGSLTTWTWSAWVKRGTLGVLQTLFGTSSTEHNVFFTSGNVLTFQLDLGGVDDFKITTTQVFRDPSAWYHIVVVWDTTNATSSNRMRFYVNGVEVTSFSITNYPTSSLNGGVNSTIAHYIGNLNTTRYFDGYLAEVNFIDGQALTPSSFGVTNGLGIWQPVRYGGSYGTNGFYLPFTNTASTTTLGYDFSSNGNNWTTNNISVTAGSTYDSMTDVPTLTSATAANFCVLNPLVADTTATITNGNLSATGSTTTFANARATFTLSSGKWYWEQTITGSSTFDIGIGLCTDASIKSSASNIRQTGWYNIINGSSGDVGTSANGGSNTTVSTTNWATTDVIMVAYDASTGYIWFGRNGTWYPPTTGGTIGNPAAGTNQTISAVSDLIPASWHYNTNAGTAVNFGQRPFAYTPPTGFVALNTFNLPTPTIGATASTQANKNFDATLYTGNGTSQSVVNAGGFQPDWVWIKMRSGAAGNELFDSARGADIVLFSNATNAESNSGTMSAFNSNGFTPVYQAADISTNNNGDSYVGWQWRANGAGSSNTDGTITSTVSANTSAGFSVVTYTGTGANATVGHGLGIAPKMVIVKNRETAGTSWKVYHIGLTSAAYALEMEVTGAEALSATVWNSTAPTSTVVNLGSNAGVNQSSITHVAYCFAEVAGYSKFGSYTGNGSADGPFVYTGFRPAYVMVKLSSGTDSWFVVDYARDPFNTTTRRLQPNSSGAESTSATDYAIDFTANGFKLRTDNGQINGSGSTYIYAAFAQTPTKFANAR